MIALEYHAHISPLRKKHPIEKIVCALVPLLLNIYFQNIGTSILIVLIMFSLTLLVGKISILYYMKLLLLPIAFLFSSVLVILWTIVFEPLTDDVLFQFQIGPIYFGIFEESLWRAATLFCVAISSVSCLYFLILTTTIQSILYGFKLCRMPIILLELIALTYRFIFVFLDSSRTIFFAQKSRLGNITFLRLIKSMGLLVSALFVQVFHHTRELEMSINARSVDGYKIVINQQFNYEKSSWIFITLIISFIFIFNIILGELFK